MLASARAVEVVIVLTMIMATAIVMAMAIVAVILVIIAHAIVIAFAIGFTTRSTIVIGMAFVPTARTCSSNSNRSGSSTTTRNSLGDRKRIGSRDVMMTAVVTFKNQGNHKHNRVSNRSRTHNRGGGSSRRRKRIHNVYVNRNRISSTTRNRNHDRTRSTRHSDRIRIRK